MAEKPIHQAIYRLAIAMGADGSGLPPHIPPKVRLIFSDNEQYLRAVQALMSEIDPSFVRVQRPPKFQIAGVDIALLMEDR